jgi:hypothetical protein
MRGMGRDDGQGEIPRLKQRIKQEMLQWEIGY